MEVIKVVICIADLLMQATNQLLTALDRLRHLPNILVCCTSNLLEAIVSKYTSTDLASDLSMR